ncbi:hypothetical protein NL676_034067 [Syzygium grande]|nr:hypothetical protein NL676_034067 [Syzygium grande]
MAVAGNLWLCLVLLSSISLEGAPDKDKIYPGFLASQMDSIDDGGVFLLSNSSIFGFGFVQASGPPLYSLAVVHFRSSTVVWSANRDNPVTNSDTFDFDENGNAFLQKAGSTVWSTNTSGRGVSAIELRDSGNLVLLGKDSTVVWQSFDHPTDTLLSNQDFTQGMRLVSPGLKNLTYTLEIEYGDMILSAGYITPQPYWSMGKDSRHLKNQNGGQVVSATMVANSWRFYDENRTLLWQFPFSDDSEPNTTWIAVLGKDRIISFSSLGSGGTPDYSPVKIPSDACSTPEPCDPYVVCYTGNMCQCLSVLTSHPNCSTGLGSPCDHSKASIDLVSAGEGIGYFALGFVSPSLNADLNGCKTSCLNNCSCLALFYQNSSGDCYLFDSIGALQGSDQNSGFVSYVKVLTGGGQGGFGSVYRGVLPDGTRLAVKKLEGIGQGKKEFRAEVCSIGSIRHHNLVRLKGFCAEDFGLAKLMTREQSRVVTTIRGTRGYLAPEWITGRAISEKSDVYSYGKVLFEIIGRRRNYNPKETSEKVYFPLYAFKMMEEGKLREILDPGLEIDERDEAVCIAIKVASWCIQDDMNLRPSMFEVVQMLEGVCRVPQPLTSSPRSPRLFPSFFKPNDNSHANLAAVQLLGPR